MLNTVCVGGSRGVAAYSGATVPATLKEKQVKKKRLQLIFSCLAIKEKAHHPADSY